jgi:hypothetical protein
MINLTIAIPTYERPYNLINLFKSLIKEYSKLDDTKKSYINIYISDNTRSEKNIIINKELVQDFKKVINKTYYDFNKYNIGGNYNILKCIEYPDSGWVWVIGDDDILVNNSLNYIFDLIQKFNDYSSMTFCSTQNFENPLETVDDYNEIFISNNISDYLENVYLNNACFIPCNIYNTKYYNLFSDIICETTFTQYPHFSYALLCLDSGYKNVSTNKIIVASLPPTWERINVDSRLFSLFLLPFKDNISINSIKKLIKQHRPTFKNKVAFLFRNISKKNKSIDQHYLSLFSYTRFDNDLTLKIYKCLSYVFNLFIIKK